MRLRSRLRFRRRRPVDQTSLYLSLLSGGKSVYSVELPVEIGEDEESQYVAIAQHFRTFDQGITFDRIELHARYRRKDAALPSKEVIDNLLDDMLEDERDDRDPDERRADEEAEDAERKLDEAKAEGREL